MSVGTLTRRDQLLGEAAKLVGIPYRLDPPPDGVNNLDCSLYVIVTFRDAGLPFPSGVRTAEQIRDAVATLIASNWLCSPDRPRRFGPRSRVGYRVNPRLRLENESRYPKSVNLGTSGQQG